METKEIKVTVENGVKELIIRHGEAEPVVKFRDSIKVLGNLSVVAAYLKNPPKWFTAPGENGDAPIHYSSINVSRDKGRIVLIVDEGMQWESRYAGELAFEKAFLEFQINTGKSYTTFELADFIKMNRSYFESKDIAMRLVSELRSFKAKVDKELENADDNRGNKRVLISQIVDSNIPNAFKLDMPIFKGYPKQLFEVEININASDFSCTLISPEANDYSTEIKNDLIDAELKTINELFPELKIFEI